MQVLKFGGSSVANADNIKKVIEILKSSIGLEDTLVVVSAMGGITDLLLSTAAIAANNDVGYKIQVAQIENRHIETVKLLIPITNQSAVLSMVKMYCNQVEDICNGIFLLGELSPRTKDKIVSFGEILSSQIIAAALNTNQINITWKDARELIITDSNYEAATVQFEITNKKINQYFLQKNNRTYILPGFVAANELGYSTTLGRGGSDYTAAILAGALGASILQIWTDVSGMMTADPRLVNNVKRIPQISYQEAMELSHFGAKVIYPPTIQPVMSKNIPVWVKNTFAPQDEGTVIKNIHTSSNNVITGISCINKITLISLEGSGMVGIPGFSKRLFEALAIHKINVILITQSSSEHSISVGIDASNVQMAKQAVDAAFAYEIKVRLVEPLSVENDLAIVAIVGDNMKNHTGVSGKMFSSLGSDGVNIRAIAQGSSERNISAVIASEDVAKALNVLHETFFETSYKQVHVFLAGVGNVGKKLITQLQQQASFLKESLRLNIKIVGVANSKMAIINEAGINLQQWENAFESAELTTTQQYIDTILKLNLRNAIFVDVTASTEVAMLYNNLLQKSIAVVACNKVACSANYNYYASLKQSVKEYQAKFLYETNVGAGLPIIGTLNDIINSGDKILSIEAVLSGTLNYVFNNYDATKSFATIVKQAQNEGFTEPDPRLDLSGKDVMRKIMILAREAGEVFEIDDVLNESFMPASCMQGDVANFYKEMEAQEPHFKNLYEEAKIKNCKLKFVAKYDPNNTTTKAKVGLQLVSNNHPFYHLYGKDNIVLFYSNRYSEQPLMVKGAGAGAEVTASGVFADIIRATQR